MPTTKQHNPFDLGSPCPDGYKIVNANTDTKQQNSWEQELEDLEFVYTKSDLEEIMECDGDSEPLLRPEDVRDLITHLLEETKRETVTENTSDGYHTFKELYDHRIALFKALMWAHWKKAWASKLHDDGSCLDGWFIAGIHTPVGDITYHLPMKEWDELFMCRPDETGNNNICIMTLDKAPKWDGHTPADVIERLKSLNITNNNEEK